MLTPLVVSLLIFVAADTPKVSNILARATWPLAEPSGDAEMVFRSPKQLAMAALPNENDISTEAAMKAVTEAVKVLKVDRIDWEKQMVILVRVAKTHPAFGIEQFHITAINGKLIVRYGYCEPVAAREQDNPPKPAIASVLVLVDRFDGEVKFESAPRSPK